MRLSVWAGMCLLFVSASARAQLADSLAGSSFEHYPAAESSDVPGKTSVNVARAYAGVPLPLGKSTTLVAAAGYELVDVHSSAADPFQLHAIKLTTGVIQDIGRFQLVVLGDAGFASDFSDPVGSHDLLLSGTGLLTYAFSDSFKLGAGILYDRRSGDLAPLPALLLNLRASERFRVRGFAPAWLNAEYRLTSWLDVGIRSTWEGNRFHLGQDKLSMGDAELAYSNFTVGPKVTFNFTDWLHLDVYTPGALYRRFELFQNDESIGRHDLSPVLGYGVRFWVAPSGW